MYGLTRVLTCVSTRPCSEIRVYIKTGLPDPVRAQFRGRLERIRDTWDSVKLGRE